MNYQKNRAILSSMIKLMGECELVEAAISIAVNRPNKKGLELYKVNLKRLKSEFEGLKARL